MTIGWNIDMIGCILMSRHQYAKKLLGVTFNIEFISGYHTQRK